MENNFKYTAKFSSVVLASKDILNHPEEISQASLDSLKEIIPEDVDLSKNVDLLAVAFNGALVNKFNRNGDGIDSETAVQIIDQFKHKPTNIEHQKQKVVGHIINASFSELETNRILTKEEALQKQEPYNIALSSLIYKTVNPEFVNLVEQSVDKESEMYHKVSASWEIGFNDFVLAVGGDNLSQATIIEDPDQIEEMKHSLKAFGGEGKNENGQSVHRLIRGEIYPLGIGFTANPAADVKGLTVSTNKPDQPKTEKSKKNISQINNIDVTNKNTITMEHNEILNNLVSALEEKVSNKKFSEEAVATVSKIINDAIRERNESFVEEREALETEKAELAKAAEEKAQEMEELKTKLDEAVQRVNELEQSQKEQAAIARFDERMSAVEEIYELDDASRKIVAYELKDLEDSDEAFASFQEKLQVVLKHQNKEFIAKQEEEFNAKLSEAVEKRIEELKSDATSEEEVVEEALDNTSSEESAIANNNGESSEEDLSLKEKFKQAFSEDNLTINY